MPDRLTELVAKHWPQWIGGDAPPLEWVLASTARPVAQTSVILYGIDSRARRPALVAKVSREPRFGFLTENEAARATEAREAIGLEQEATIPRPFGLIRTDRDLYLVSEYAPGGLRWDRLGTGEREVLTDRLTAWLADLHARSERPLGAAARGPDPIVETYLQIFESDEPVAKRLHEAEESMTAEFAAASNEILVHGDFWPGNWRVGRAGFQVIDWEHAHWSPTPVLDEFLYPLSGLTLGRQDAEPDLMSFTKAYRTRRGLPLRSDEEAVLASIWTAAEVATRTQRRWGVVEDWSYRWQRVVTRLATL